MDKEQALIILKELHKDAFYSVRTALETIIPELKEESNDERIKKEIIEYIKIGTYRKDWISWLEKQGKRDKFKDAIQIGDKVTRNRDGVLVNLSQLERVAKKENLCEQKATGKIEPKFKIGDWIVLYPSKIEVDRKVVQISRIEKCQLNMYWTTEGTWFGDGTDARLWTIKDAKDGDIIYIKRYRTNDEWLLIFKKIEGQNNFIDVYDYCAFSITSDNMYYGSNGCWGLLNNNKDIVCPATKEQRILLLSKISGSGYEWNEKEKVIVKVQKKNNKL